MFGKKVFRHREHHKSSRAGWLRAAVLGANDGILSTASLIVGVAAAQSTRENILISGFAGLVAGAMSMAAGEFVSVSSQADTEKADLAQEQEELLNNTEYETEELAQLYVGRGLDPQLARTVAEKLMEHDALGAHARDELGITEFATAKPIQAAITSAITFALGAALPLLIVLWAPLNSLLMAVPVLSILFLAILGMLSARVGGANPLKGAVRVVFWGALAMAMTAIVGHAFGTAVY